jgi:lysophospholipase L1-like esterase
VSPSAGSTLGGTVLWLTGSNFRADSAVRIGGVPAITTVLGARTLQAVAPPQGPGLRDVTVVSGALESTLTGAFTYVVTFPVVSSVTPGVGPSTGGTTVVLKGADLRDVSAVLFGGVPVERLDILDPRTIRVTTAPHAAGPVSVEVRRSDGLRGELPAAYTYTPATATDRVLAFGDSITWGTTSSALDLGGTIFLTSFRVPAGQDFPSGLQAALAAKYPGQMVSVVNSGVPGECASCPGQGAARFPGTLTPDLDLVLVLEGVNDTIARSPTAAIASSLRSMVLDAQARGKAVMIGTLLPIYRRADRGPDCSEDQSSLSYCYKANPAQATQINQEIRAIAAATGAILVDFHKEFLADPSLISPDGLHPTAAGYSRMAEVLSRIVVSSFEARRPVVP